MTALRRLLFLLIAAGVAGVWLRRRLEPASSELPGAGPGPLEIEPAGDPPGAQIAASRLEMGPVTDEMNAIPLPLEEGLALVDTAEPEAAAAEDSEEDAESVDIVAVVDDLLEPPS